MARLDADELGRRLAAAMAYRRMNALTVGAALGKFREDGTASGETVKNWKGGDFPNANRQPIIDALAVALDIPPEWFTADYGFMWMLPPVDNESVDLRKRASTRELLDALRDELERRLPGESEDETRDFQAG